MFETLLVRDGRLQALELHLERLRAAVAQLYGQELPPQLGERMRAVAARLSGGHRLRASVRPGPHGLLADVTTEPLAGKAAQKTVILEPVLLPGGLGPYKWCDRRLLERHGTAHAVPLLVDSDGHLLEAAWANVWILEGRRLATPPADGRLLAGITRALLLALSPRLGLTAATEPITLERARRADAIFLTSSLRHAVAARLAGRPSSGPGTAPAPTSGKATVGLIRTALGQLCWQRSSCQLERCRCAAAADTNQSNTRAKRGSIRHSS